MHLGICFGEGLFHQDPFLWHLKLEKCSFFLFMWKPHSKKKSIGITACLFRSSKYRSGNLCFSSILPHHKSFQKFTCCPDKPEREFYCQTQISLKELTSTTQNPYNLQQEPATQYQPILYFSTIKLHRNPCLPSLN